MDEKPDGQLESWAIVEVFGHSRFAGFVQQVPMGGAVMIRIDVPEVVAREEEYEDYNGVKQKRQIPGVPAFTKFLGVSSIFSLTPCSKETAIAAIEQFRSTPITILDIGARRQPAMLEYDDDDDTGLD